jgi:hypothetical protein
MMERYRRSGERLRFAPVIDFPTAFLPQSLSHGRFEDKTRAPALGPVRGSNIDDERIRPEAKNCFETLSSRVLAYSG